MKHFLFVPNWELWPNLTCAVKLKWQWSVAYERRIMPKFKEDYWEQDRIYTANRKRARQIVANLRYFNYRNRNIRIERRLVQVNWNRYNDSFSYNAKGNGNGR